MKERYEPNWSEYAWRDLDEFLCEYVDGTMDPVVREVFEEYVRDNPELAEHVECLCQARQILSRAHCPCHLKADFLDRLRRRVTAEAIESRRFSLPDLSERVGSLAAFTSALLVMTMAGMLVGAMLAEEGQRSVETEQVVATDRFGGGHVTFSDMFVPPASTVLRVDRTVGMTPVLPRRLPLAPLWVDADWRGRAVQTAASW